MDTDKQIWKEIFHGLCVEYDVTAERLNKILEVCYPAYCDEGYQIFLDMPQALFKREVPKAIRRSLLYMREIDKLIHEDTIRPGLKVLNGGKE